MRSPAWAELVLMPTANIGTIRELPGPAADDARFAFRSGCQPCRQSV